MLLHKMPPDEQAAHDLRGYELIKPSLVCYSDYIEKLINRNSLAEFPKIRTAQLLR